MLRQPDTNSGSAIGNICQTMIVASEKMAGQDGSEACSMDVSTKDLTHAPIMHDVGMSHLCGASASVTDAPEDDDSLMDTPMLTDSHASAESAEDAVMAMKRASGGRRKQSKPVRVCLDTDFESSLRVTPGTTPASGTLAESNGASSQACKPIARVTPKEHKVAPKGTEQCVDCDLCSEQFTSHSALTEHIQREHCLSDDRGEETYLTRYHQLGSELQQEASQLSPDSIAKEQSESSRTIPGNCMPDGAYRESQGTSPGDSKSKIFHPDAYCKLCDREFCNRYFLKTHKANMHGIYESPLSSVGSSPPIPMGPTGAEVNGITPQAQPLTSNSTDDSEKPSVAENTIATPVKLPTLPMNTVVTKSGDIATSRTPPPTVLSTPLISTAVTPSKTIAPNISNSASKQTRPDMEDYCEICQKHFCNKYYLRKHKHDVHGIVPDVTPNKRSRPQIPSSLTNCLPTTSAALAALNASAASAPLNILPQTPTSLSTSLANAGIGGTDSIHGVSAGGLANLMFINPFTPPVAILQAQPMMAGNPHGFNNSPLVVPPPPVIPPSSESPKITTSSPSNVPMPKDALRGMGVLNADAYCELCRKEFCNRYFLQIHKANKHGIYIPDDPPMPLGPILQVPNITTSTADSQTPRLNVIEPDTIKNETIDNINNNDKPAENSSSLEVCDVCKKEFANPYSLKVHLLNAHNIKPKDGDFSFMGEPPSAAQLEKFANSASLQGTMFSNMIAAKLADRVTCDICHKEVCNKYFLKTHKMKVHGIQEQSLAEKEQRDRVSPAKVTPDSVIRDVKPQTQEAQILPSAEPLVRPKDEELLKMGIDPEAYCEICKKEFCSKYFLKTHKLNIHGIKSPGMEMPRPKPMMGLQPPPPLTVLPNNMFSKEALNAILPLHLPQTHLLQQQVAAQQQMENQQLQQQQQQQQQLQQQLQHHQQQLLLQQQQQLQQQTAQALQKKTPQTPTQQLSPQSLQQQGSQHIPYPQQTNQNQQEQPQPFQDNKQQPQKQPDQQTASQIQSNVANTSPPHQSQPQPIQPQPHLIQPQPQPVQPQPHLIQPQPHLIQPQPHLIQPQPHLIQPQPHQNSPTERQRTPPQPTKSRESSPPQQQVPPLKQPPNIPFLPSFQTPGKPSILPGPPMLGPLMGSMYSPLRDSPGQHNWKQSSFSTPRVMCEICNKELCNKYFLKTHMLRKHGIQVDSLTGEASPLPNGLAETTLKQTPTDGVAPLKGLDLSLPDSSKTKIGENENSCDDSSQSGKDIKSIQSSEGDSLQGDGVSTVTAKTWSIPAQAMHGLQNGDIGADAMDIDGIDNIPGKENMCDFSPNVQKCHLCGMNFSEKVTLQLHLIQDHHGQVTVQAGDLNRTNSATSISQALRKKYRRKTKAGLLKRLGGVRMIGDKVKSAIVNHIRNNQRSNKFRCAHCQQRFGSRNLCQAHIRTAHANVQSRSSLNTSTTSINNKGIKGELSKSASPLSYKELSKSSFDADSQQTSSPFALTQSQEYDPETKMNVEQRNSNCLNSPPVARTDPLQQQDGQMTMQSFTLSERNTTAGGSTFLRSVVHLPVRHKLSQPVTATFDLTPMEQWRPSRSPHHQLSQL